MKMIFLSYKESLDDLVMQKVESFGIRSFTKWKEVQDRGDSGYPKMGTHIWPGFNSALVFLAEDDIAVSLFEAVREYNKETTFEIIKGFSWTIDDVC